MSDDNARRLFELMDEMRREQAEQKARLARMEEKLDNNANRCFDRGTWMKEVDAKIDDLTNKANQALGAKAVLLGMLGLIGAVVGAAWEAWKK